jgi:hypothetical protein
VVEEKVNLSKLLWVNRKHLTERQRLHMTNRQPGSMTQEQVKTYRDQFTIGQQAKVNLAGKVNVVLKMPSLSEYIASSYQWISKVKRSRIRASSSMGFGSAPLVRTLGPQVRGRVRGRVRAEVP